MLGINISCACPKGYEAPSDAVELAKKYSKETWAHAQYVSDKSIINIKNFKARFYLMEIKHY